MTQSIDEQFEAAGKSFQEGRAVDGITLLKVIWTRLSEEQFYMVIQGFDDFIIAPLDATFLDSLNSMPPGFRNVALITLDELAEMLDSTPAEFLKFGAIEGNLGIAYSRVGIRYYNVALAKYLNSPESFERLEKATIIFAKSIPHIMKALSMDSNLNISPDHFNQKLSAMKDKIRQLRGY